jgi:hypothetical protein
MKCVDSLLHLDRLLNQKQISHFVSMIANDSLVTRVRNCFANSAAFDTDAHGRYTHLLFIDADSVFEASDVLRMIEADKPIIGLPFALKGLHWEFIAQAAQRGIPHDRLKYFGANPNINSSKPVQVDGVTPIDQIGAGMLLIKTDVLKALAEAHPERKYQLYPGDIEKGRDFGFDFFRVGVGHSAPDVTTKRYLSEDFLFIEDVKQLGFEVYLLPAATGHIGIFEYVFDPILLAATGAIGPRNAQFKIEKQDVTLKSVQEWKRTRCPKGLLNDQNELNFDNSKRISAYIAEHFEGQFTAENLDKAVEALRSSLAWYLAPQAQPLHQAA